MNKKNYEDLTFSDDFMFGKVTEDKEISRGLLKCLLQREIGELEEIQNEKRYQEACDGKGIRLDLYSRDKDNVYDAEMQNKNNLSVEQLELPKRSHYYHAMIANDQLNKGDDYSLLGNSNIIFICTFDPFGLGEAWYHFSMKEEKNNSLELNDGVHSYFFNATYLGDDIPDGIRNLYRYLQTEEVSDELTMKIDAAVNRTRMNSIWRSSYMKEKIALQDEHKAGRIEGREEGVISTLLDLVKDGSISTELAAKKANKSVEEIEDLMREKA